MIVYHFTSEGTPTPPANDLYDSAHPLDALQYASGKRLHIIRTEGARCEIIASIDATDMLRAFARQCALDVIHLWDAPAIVREYLETKDEETRIMVWNIAWDVASDTKNNDAARAAARAAALVATVAKWDTVWDTASLTAWAMAKTAKNVAWDAAWDAAWNRQKIEFKAMVDSAFEDAV